jgi:hypothetical protein
MILRGSIYLPDLDGGLSVSHCPDDDMVTVGFHQRGCVVSDFKTHLGHEHAEHLYAELGKVLGKIPMAQEIS